MTPQKKTKHLLSAVKSLALCQAEKEAADPENILETLCSGLILWGFYQAECVDLAKCSKGIHAQCVVPPTGCVFADNLYKSVEKYLVVKMY